MDFAKYLAELQEMIAKFMDIHNNPHDTSKHNELADKLTKLDTVLPGSTENKKTPTSISASVGKGGDNETADVKIIQNLLNQNGAKLTEDGDCGPITIAAIEKFQSQMGMKNPDGVISPGRSTWKALVKGIAASDNTSTTDNNSPTDETPVAETTPEEGNPQAGKIPSNFVRITNQKEVTAELTKAAVYYLNVFTKKYPRGQRQGHYGEYIIFKTTDGKEFLAHFEIHTKYGADPSKPETPHPSIGLFKNKENDAEDGDNSSDSPSTPTNDSSIGNSVGKDGVNEAADVKIIQGLLNKNGAKLTEDGDCGPITITAIEKFQSQMGMKKPDGIISPGRSTWKALVKGIAASDDSSNSADNSENTNNNDTSNTGGNSEPLEQALGTTSKINASVGDKGKNNPEDVILVKTLLNKYGNNFELTGDADTKLTEAIKKFQRDYRGSTKPDGRVDANGATWRTLLGIGRIMGSLVKVSKQYGVDPAVILAIQSIESGGNGFLSDGRPKILFEGHVFWRQLKNVGKDPVALSKGNEDILYPKFTREHYVGGAAEYTRLARAKKMHKIAALKSASWGEFQIMGFNHKVVGYSDVESFVDAMHEAGANQLSGVMEFLKNNKLIRHVQGPNKDWTALARGYNGAGQNGYDVKLEKAYARFSKLNL